MYDACFCFASFLTTYNVPLFDLTFPFMLAGYHSHAFLLQQIVEDNVEETGDQSENEDQTSRNLPKLREKDTYLVR